MSMSSITEAPPWPHEQSVVREDRPSVLREPERIELVAADPGQLTFCARRQVLAPVFLCPLLLALGSLPWLAPPPMTPARAATSALCVAAATGLAAWARPRRRRLQVLARPRAAADAVVVHPSKVRWVLDAGHAPGAARTTHRVALAAEGEERVVLQGTDPERLLWQFSEVLRHWPGPVDCRWGLPDAARPWSVEPHSGPRARNGEDGVSAAIVPLAPRPLVWCMRAMAGFVVVDLAFLLATAGAGLEHVHPLSALLAAAFAGCLATLAAALGSGSTRLRVGGYVRREAALFGLRRRSGGVRVESVRGVHVVGAPGAERWHVLIDSADGPLALEAPRADAAALARDAERAIAAARSGPAPRSAAPAAERRR